MAVKIRLMRIGKRKQPSYRVVVADGRSPRDGRFIDQIGRYDPRQDPSVVEIDNEKAVDWLEKGAQPTDAARKLLEISGAWGRFRVGKGDVHVVDSPESKPRRKAPVEEPAAQEEAAEQAEEEPVSKEEQPAEEEDEEA